MHRKTSEGKREMRTGLNCIYYEQIIDLLFTLEYDTILILSDSFQIFFYFKRKIFLFSCLNINVIYNAR